MRAVAWSPDGQHIATATDDGLVRAWDAATGESWIVLSCGDGVPKLLAWAPDSRRLAVGQCAHDPVVIWDTLDEARNWAFSRQDTDVRGLARQALLEHWRVFSQKPLGALPTGAGLLREIADLVRLDKLSRTIAVTDNRYYHHVSQRITNAFMGIADSFTTSGQFISPRRTQPPDDGEPHGQFTDK